MPKYVKPPLVEVTWTDACDVTNVTVRDCSEIKVRVGLRKGRTVRGLLAYHDEVMTVLAHDFDPPDAADDDRRPEIGNFTVIPTGWVTRLRYIERGPRRQQVKVVPTAALEGEKV